MAAQVAQAGECNTDQSKNQMTSQPVADTASQCPTCRADVTVSPGDISASTTLTPVVDAQANASARNNANYGATGTVGGAGEPDTGGRLAWFGDLRDRVMARAGAAVSSVNESLRAAVRGGDAPPPARAAASDERTPLRATDV